MSQHRKNLLGALVTALLLLLVVALLFGATALVVMMSWNHVLPTVFDGAVKPLTYRQAVVLCVLVKFLTDGFGVVLSVLRRMTGFGGEKAKKPRTRAASHHGRQSCQTSPNLRTHWENLDPEQRSAIMDTIRKLHESRHDGGGRDHGGRSDRHDDGFVRPGRGRPFRRDQ